MVSPVKPILLNRPEIYDYNISGIKYIKNNNIGNELRKPQFLEKKRRNEIYIKNDQDSDEKSEKRNISELLAKVGLKNKTGKMMAQRWKGLARA